MKVKTFRKIRVMLCIQLIVIAIALFLACISFLGVVPKQYIYFVKLVFVIIPIPLFLSLIHLGHLIILKIDYNAEDIITIVKHKDKLLPFLICSEIDYNYTDPAGITKIHIQEEAEQRVLTYIKRKSTFTKIKKMDL